jgi:hypothetical protein
MRWTEHTARMKKKHANCRKEVPLERLESRWKKILNWILERYARVVWTGWIWLRMKTGGGFL